MSRLTALSILVSALAAQACMSSTLVLHVRPDGSGQAVITSRVFESGIRAFDGLFPDRPAPALKLEELLPAPGEGELERELGARVRIVSTKLDRATDGGIRTTIAEFADVTALRLRFPPVFMSMSQGFGIDAVGDQPVISFAVKPHENGDRLLLVKMPDERLPQAPSPADQPVTVFKTDSPEELLFKQAIKHAAVGLFVELEQPLLRTNAPAQKGNRATILNLDVDKMVNAMDEPKVRRMMNLGSMQEMLWQVGDLPGAVVPVDHEIFLEYEGPQAPPAAAQTPAPQAPPDTEIYLAPIKTTNGALEIGPAINITNSPGYDNQPFFTPDGKAVLFTSVRREGPQTDIYRYDVAARQVSQVTNTPESEYSPTITPAGHLSVIRVELDEAKTQRLWQFTADGRDPRVVLESVKPVGYHAWADGQTLALFVLGAPATLQLADTRTGAAAILATDIGRSIQRIPGQGSGPATISFVQRERTGDAVSLVIKELDPSTRQISVLTPAIAGSREADCAWTPDGTLLVVNGGTVYGWRRGQTGWQEITTLERLGLAGVTRLAVSPKGDYLALVAPPRQRR